MYRMHLPMVVVFNKVDIQDCGTIESWMRDYEVGFRFPFYSQSFQDAVSDDQSDSFMIPLTRSMGLVLEEFYNTYLHNEVITRMRTVGVSSVTGEGMGDLETAIQEAKEEYFKVFLPMIQVGDGWLLKGRQIARRKQARRQRRR